MKWMSRGVVQKNETSNPVTPAPHTLHCCLVQGSGPGEEEEKEVMINHRSILSCGCSMMRFKKGDIQSSSTLSPQLSYARKWFRGGGKDVKSSAQTRRRQGVRVGQQNSLDRPGSLACPPLSLSPKIKVSGARLRKCSIPPTPLCLDDLSLLLFFFHDQMIEQRHEWLRHARSQVYK